MSRKASTVAALCALCALAIAASGCTGDSNAEAESPVDITKLRAELKERFGTPPNEAPWYRHITSIDWADGRLVITTDLGPEADDVSEEVRGAMCGEPLRLAFEQQAEPDTSDLSAEVFDSGGVAVGGCA